VIRMHRPLITLAVLAGTARATPAPGALIEDVMKSYAKTGHMHAHYRQDVHDPTFDRTTTSEGTVWLAAPSSMAWIEPLHRFFSNGKILWAIEDDSRRVIVESAASSELTAAAVFLLDAKLDQHYDVAIDASGTYGTKTDVVLALTPKDADSDWKRIELVVDPASAQVKESIVIPATGNESRFTFDQIDTKTRPPARAFTPSGTHGYKTVYVTD
jgi:outer membrane lipoprotein-sorting protein